MNARDLIVASPAAAFAPRRAHRAKAPVVSSGVELRVCVNRGCARQGSREILLALEALAPPEIDVVSCGCLGRCGAGPNAVAVPSGTLFGHVTSASSAARVLADIVGPAFDAGSSLEALGLRKRGEIALENGYAAAAESYFSQAINLNPMGGLHTLFKCRSTARLLMGDTCGALSDAEQAIRMAAKYPQAYIAQGDALLEMEKLDAADKAYGTALRLNPALRRSKSFKVRVAKLQDKLVGSNVPE